MVDVGVDLGVDVDVVVWRTDSTLSLVHTEKRSFGRSDQDGGASGLWLDCDSRLLPQSLRCLRRTEKVGTT